MDNSESDSRKSFLLAFDDKLTMDQLGQAIALTQHRDEPLGLLTLSACDIAEGGRPGGTGAGCVAIKAGARSALATLWSISDEASRNWWESSYQQLHDPSISKATPCNKRSSAGPSHIPTSGLLGTVPASTIGFRQCGVTIISATRSSCQLRCPYPAYHRGSRSPDAAQCRPARFAMEDADASLERPLVRTERRFSLTRLRIGIVTGQAVAGSLGSAERLKCHDLGGHEYRGPSRKFSC
jgi:hypothetical protein